jgi:hypothetical protein
VLSLPFQAEKRTRIYEWSPMTRLIATTVTIDPAQEQYLSELGGFVFPCNEAAFEAMLDGVAERGGGGLTSAE